MSTSQALRKLVTFVTPHRRPFILGLIALAAGSSVNLLFPEVARRVLDQNTLPFILNHLGSLTLGLAALFVLQGAAFFARSYLLGRVGQLVVADIRRRLFTSIVSRDISFFDQHRSGDLVSRVNADAAIVQETVSIRLSVILRYGIQVVFGVVLMAWMSWKMTGVILASVVTMIAVSGVFVRNLRAASRAYQAGLGRLSSFTTECFSGSRLLKSLGAARDTEKMFDVVNHDVLEAGLTRTSSAASFSSGASLLLNLLLLLVQWYGIHLVVSGELKLNDLAAFVLYGAIVAVSFTFLISAYTELVQNLGGLERVFELLDTVESAELSTVEPNHTAPRGPRIVVEDLHFAYTSRQDEKVLAGLSLQCEAGETTALVGPSGSGKSSLVSLLLRFYSPVQGSITFDGRSISSIAESELRSMVAWVPHEPHLFGFTVRENLLLGNGALSASELEQSVKEWGFLRFVRELPRGLDTELGELGSQLSSGQRQRLAIARAVLRRPAVLILDEATSGLDSESEQSVLETIRAYLPAVTLLVISHRLATVKAARVVYVIRDGLIVESGTHDSLRGAHGLYRQYADRQAIG